MCELVDEVVLVGAAVIENHKVVADVIQEDASMSSGPGLASNTWFSELG